jgi:putative acetyltransferase
VYQQVWLIDGEMEIVFMSTIILREPPDSPDATSLIAELDAVLSPLYPAESRHGYSVAKLIAQQVAFFVLRHDGTPAGCGGMQMFGAEYGELKRMYVRPQFRGRGFGKLLLDHLTDYARAHGVGLLRLETGIHQTVAIGLYERMGFQIAPPFGDYANSPFSLCYEKRIT